MLSYKDILYSFTKEISKNFNEDIFVEGYNIQDNKKSCFFVQILPEEIQTATKKTDIKSFLVDIKYLPDWKKKKTDLFDILNKLENIFTRNIKVKDRYLTFSEKNGSIEKDEIGNYVQFLISINYHEQIYFEEEKHELMEELNMRFKGRSD
ncbi:phage tail terminator family protein [Clostridioides difficile]